jgi:hypothetical protein
MNGIGTTKKAGALTTKQLQLSCLIEKHILRFNILNAMKPVKDGTACQTMQKNNSSGRIVSLQVHKTEKSGKLPC